MRSLFNSLWLMFCFMTLCFGGCGAPGSTYGGSPLSESESPGEETIPGDDSQNGNTASPDAGLTCLEVYNAVSACYTVYYECAGLCQDQGCADVCEADYSDCFQSELSLGSPSAQEQFGALRACEESVYQDCYDEGLVLYNDCSESCADDACVQACGAQANDILQTCMVEACATEYGVCGVSTQTENTAPNDGAGTGSTGGGDTGSSGSGGSTHSLNCGELYECEDACNGNQACGQACYDRGTDQAQAQWTSLIQCGQSMCDGLVSNAAEYRDCLEYYCSAQYNTCFSNAENATPGGTGSQAGATCGDGYACVQECYITSTNQNSFYVCVDTCYASMSSEAVALMDNLVSCSNIQCSDVPGSIENYYRCQQDFCPSQYNACVEHTISNSVENGSSNEPGHTSCIEIHEGILEMCVPAHSECLAACTTDSCAQTCGEDMETCIDGQQVGAPASAVENFQAMYQCRQANYEACYNEANAAYMACVDVCGETDTACQNACNTEATSVYEGCFSSRCASEYSACGL